MKMENNVDDCHAELLASALDHPKNSIKYGLLTRILGMSIL